MIHEELYVHLKVLARRHSCETYTEVGEPFGLSMEIIADQQLISRLLCDINRYEYREDRPLLSAVVVRKDSGVPGIGFYRNAMQLGRIPPISDKRYWRTEEAQHFWQEELSRVYDYWSRH